MQRVEDSVAAINRIKPDLVFVSGTDVSGIDTAASAEHEWSKITADPRLVVMPGPPGDANIHDCYTKTSSPGDCISTVGSTYAPADRAFAAHDHGIFVDPSPWFCLEGECPAFVGTTVTKMDNRHMTPAYALRIAPVMREDFERVGILPKSDR